MSGTRDTALLDGVVRTALRWLDARRDAFRLPPDVTTDADLNLTLKPLGELAELTHVIRVAHPEPDVRALADGLFGLAWDEAGEGAVFAELFRGEPHATYPLELYGAFAQAGLRHPEADALLPALTRLRGWRVAREDHTRTLAVLNAERRCGLPPHADFAAVLAATGLGSAVEPWALDRTGLYGITHDVFHLTDWGRAPGRMPQSLARYLALWVPAWLECWLEEEVWDLVGELLAVAACLPAPVDDAAAWHRLAAAQAPDGSVPELGPAGPPDPAEDAEQVFLHRYHSTLVTAFAATLARIAPASGPAPAAPAEAAAPAAGRAARATAPARVTYTTERNETERDRREREATP